MRANLRARWCANVLRLLENRAAAPAGLTRRARLTLCTVLTFGAALSAALSAVPAAQADLGPPVRVKLLGDPRAAEAGKLFEGVLEVTARGDVDLSVDVSGFRVGDSSEWSSVQLDAPAPIALGKQQSLRIPFHATPSDPNVPLIFEYEVDGRTFQKTLDLSATNAQRALTRRPLIRNAAGDQVPFPGVAASKQSLRPQPAGVEADAPSPARAPFGKDGALLRVRPTSMEDPNDVADPAKSRNIRVFGRFVYERSDGTTMGVDGATVRIYDEDSTWDELLDHEATDTDGNYDMTFNWDPCFLCDGQPDIYVEFEAANTEVDVEDATWEINYKWSSGTTDDYGGTSLNEGWLEPSDEGEHPSLHILTDVTRGWRWLLNREGYDQPHTDVQWPDGSTGAYYNSFWEEIHVSTGRQWNEDTHIHEYGHHFLENFAQNPSPDYCNGICDNDGCGHCIWCQETDHDAFNEGWPNWLADVVTRSLQGDYGIAPMNFRSQEALSTCSGTLDNPLITEGFLGALCRDIEDSGNEDEPLTATTFRDRLSLGTNEIFDVIDFDEPTTPWGFLIAFKNRFPSQTENLWQTGMNNGYDFDQVNPGAVGSLTSTSHTAGVSSPDGTVDFTWTRATDDASGVDGYSVSVTAASATPDAVMDIFNVTSYTTAVLAPGSYTFNIRAHDRSGKWSGAVAHWGPIVIRAPEPANLAFTTPGGWAFSLVPRSTNDATGASVPVSATLPGNSTGTYMNVRGTNDGESTTSVGFQGRLYVDNVYGQGLAWPTIPAGSGFIANNWSPISVPGGRHTYEFRLDALGAIAETNEFDNEYALQWMWSPLALTANVAVTRVAPPDPVGGWGSVVSGALWYNCDGLRLNNFSGWWNAVYAYATDLEEDYDCRLHVASTGSQDGFATNIGFSTRAAGCLDAVIVNRNREPASNFDVGILNLYEGVSNYVAKHVISSAFTFDDSVTVAMAAGELMLLRECYVSSLNTGPVSIVVDVNPPSQAVQIEWLADTFTHGDLLDYTAAASTNSAGRARLDVNVATAGYNCLAIYRDPKDGTGAISLTIEVGKTPPEFHPYAAAGWYAPLVPRAAFDGTAASVPQPTVLNGNVAGTYLNLAVINDSPTGSPGLGGYTYMDGVANVSIGWGNFPGGATSLFNWNYALTVRGGRHTFSVRLDPLQTIEEKFEDNNITGEQWVWTPLSLALNTPVTRSDPPDRTGGWSDLTLWGFIFAGYNCDGLRSPAFAPGAGSSGYWGGVATMPGTTSNVDVRLHEMSSGAKNGFHSPLASSGWGTAASDFVVVNFNRTSFRAMDAGVVDIASSQSYVTEAISSNYLGTGGVYGPFTLGANHIVNLHEIYLSAGVQVIHLQNLDGAVDYGMTLHPYDAVYLSKSTAVTGGIEWLAPAGEDEGFNVQIVNPGYYCISVWKVGRNDLALNGSYRLRVTSGATDAPPVVTAPTSTALAAVYPNPFNPRTTVAFDLAAAQRAVVAVYDLRGNRVRTLVDSNLPAGRHEASWDGVDEAGRSVASGTYFVRFDAGTKREIRKVSLVK